MVGGVVGICGTHQGRLNAARAIRGLRIVGTNAGACCGESSVEVHSGRASNIVRACLVRQAEQSDSLALQHPHRALDPFEELLDTPAVYTLRRVGNSCFDAQLLRKATESAKV